MCSLCQVVTIPLEFLFSVLMLAVSYLIMLSQMAVMFLIRYLEYFLSKAFKPKITP